MVNNMVPVAIIVYINVAIVIIMINENDDLLH